MKRPRNRAVDYAVYLLVRGVVGFCQALSIEQSYRFADLLAAVMHRVDKRHRAVAMENLRFAFGDEYTEAQRAQIVRQVYRHFCRMLMEMLHIPRKVHRHDWRQWIQLRGQQNVLECLLDGGPVIMVSGHFGNWEMAGYLFGVFGFPPSSVARTLDNPYLEDFLRKFRERTGQSMIAKKGGYDDMLRVLRTGGVLSMLGDQDAGQRGLYVNFFGRPASTYKSIALLAMEHQVPIVIGGAYRVGPGFRYEVVCEDVIRPHEWAGRTDDLEWITQRFTSSLEQMIRRAPEQYLWLHRRWKHQPQPRGKKARAAAAAAAEGVLS